MKNRICVLLLILISGTPALATEVRKQIPLDQASVDAQGNFVICDLPDGRELVASTWMLSLGNEILAKSEPTAFESQSAQYLDYEDNRYSASVMKQDCKSGGKQGIGFQVLRGPDKGKTESHICVEVLTCK